jgi:modulator of FtsH protease
MEAFDPADWETYASTLLGAAGVLVGLIFVSLSISIQPLIQQPWLLRRAAAAIMEIAVVVVATALVLIPGQTSQALAWQLVIVGIGGVILVAWTTVRGRAQLDPSNRHHADEAALSGLFLMSLYVVFGVSLFLGSGGGMYWLVPATLLCLGRALIESWVLLVEIYR